MIQPVERFGGELAWFAARTRARAERRAAERLDRRGVEVFAPTVRQERAWSDRVRLVRVPLFPGYIFVRSTPGVCAEAVRDPGVVGFVHCGGRVAVVRPDEIEAVRRLQAGLDSSGLEVEPVELIAPGTPVRVSGGPFEGMEGVLLEDGGRSRVAVRIEALRQARAIQLPREAIEPMPMPA